MFSLQLFIHNLALGYTSPKIVYPASSKMYCWHLARNDDSEPRYLAEEICYFLPHLQNSVVYNTTQHNLNEISQWKLFWKRRKIILKIFISYVTMHHYMSVQPIFTQPMPASVIKVTHDRYYSMNATESSLRSLQTQQWSNDREYQRSHCVCSKTTRSFFLPSEQFTVLVKEVRETFWQK